MNSTGTYTGTVEAFDDRTGCGYINPDDESLATERLLVHRRSLSDTTVRLVPGCRVFFKIRIVPRGFLAFDVALGPGEYEEQHTGMPNTRGIVSWYEALRGFGKIELPDGQLAFFHVSYLESPDWLPQEGDVVCFTLGHNERGLQAYDLTLVSKAVETLVDSAGSEAEGQRILAQAILARDRRDYEEAVRLYELGMDECPTTQLVLSYAALEKNRNRKHNAMVVYERGIKIFPENAKLREDAGVLASSIGDTDRATRLLLEALDICRRTGQAGEKGVLLALVRNYSRVGTTSALQECVRAYDAVLPLFGKTNQPSPADQLLADLARVRVQHHRGELAIRFFDQLGFAFRRAALMAQHTAGAALVVDISSADLEESYGLSGSVLVHCIFKKGVSRRDLDYLDDEVMKLGGSELVDDQIAFLVVASVPTDLQRVLFNRIEHRRGGQPVAIPISQEQMESEDQAASAFRGVLDQWLYRRDLFSTNAPVAGKRFFGRDSALAELREAVQMAVPTGVFGLRKVGKTSLLKESVRRANESGDIAVYIDLLRLPDGISDTRWLYWRIGNLLYAQVSERLLIDTMKWRLCGKYDDYFDIPDGLPVGAAFDSDLSRLIAALESSNVSPTPRIALLLDEVEKLLPNALGRKGFVGFFDFFSYFRGVTQETDGFVFIVTGANNAIGEAAQFDGRDNPVFNFFREVYLKPLDVHECTNMIKSLGRGMGMRFHDAACNRVHELTGGHPYFARQYCSFISARNPTRPCTVTRDEVDSLISHYLESHGSDFQEIIERIDRDFPDERAVCELLAQEDGAVATEVVRAMLGRENFSIRHLEGYHLARIVDDSLELTMELFKLWLVSAEGVSA